MTNLQKKGFQSIAVYFFIIAIASLFPTLIEIGTAIIFCLLGGLFFESRKAIRNYKVIKVFVGWFFIIWGLGSAGCLLSYTEYTIIQNILFCLPMCLLGISISATYIRMNDRINMNLYYLYFISVGSVFSFCVAGADWLSFYIKSWLVLECLMFTAYCFFGYKVPKLEKIYAFVKV